MEVRYGLSKKKDSKKINKIVRRLYGIIIVEVEINFCIFGDDEIVLLLNPAFVVNDDDVNKYII